MSLTICTFPLNGSVRTSITFLPDLKDYLGALLTAIKDSAVQLIAILLLASTGQL